MSSTPFNPFDMATSNRYRDTGRPMSECQPFSPQDSQIGFQSHPLDRPPDYAVPYELAAPHIVELQGHELGSSHFGNERHNANWHPSSAIDTRRGRLSFQTDRTGFYSPQYPHGAQLASSAYGHSRQGSHGTMHTDISGVPSQSYAGWQFADTANYPAPFQYSPPQSISPSSLPQGSPPLSIGYEEQELPLMSHNPYAQHMSNASLHTQHPPTLSIQIPVGPQAEGSRFIPASPDAIDVGTVLLSRWQEVCDIHFELLPHTSQPMGWPGDSTRMLTLGLESICHLIRRGRIDTPAMMFAFRFIAHAAAEVLDGESHGRYISRLCQDDDRMISELPIPEGHKEILKVHLRNAWPGEWYSRQPVTAPQPPWGNVGPARRHRGPRQARNPVFGDDAALRDTSNKLFSGLFDYRDMLRVSRGTWHPARIDDDLGFRICLRALNSKRVAIHTSCGRFPWSEKKHIWCQMKRKKRISRRLTVNQTCPIPADWEIVIRRCNSHWIPSAAPIPSPDSPNHNMPENVIEAVMLPLATSPDSDQDSFHRGITQPFKNQPWIRGFINARALEILLVGTAKEYAERYPALSWNFVSAIIQVFDAPTTNSEASGGQQRSSLDQMFEAASWAIGELRQEVESPESADEQVLSPESLITSQTPSPQSGPPSRNGAVARCTLCPKVFHGRYATGNLNRHVKWSHEREHQNEDDRRCQHCRKLFERPDNALKHSRQSCKMRPEAPGLFELSS